MSKNVLATALLSFSLLLPAFPIVSAEGSSGLKTTLVAKRGFLKDVGSKATLSASSYDDPLDPYLDDEEAVLGLEEGINGAVPKKG